MAGFAVFMTFLTWGFVLLVAAIIFSVLLGSRAKRACPQATPEARSYVFASTLAPFLGLLWLLAALILHAKISNNFAHQSVGYSPDPYVTLPNRFELGSRNTYDGYVLAPGHITGVPSTGPGYVRGIIDIEWRGDNFRGTFFDFKSSGTKNFVFNTETLEITTTPSGNIPWDAANDKAQTGPQSYWVLYKLYRHKWPTYVFWALLIVGEVLIGWAVRRLRKIASASPVRLAET